MVSGADDAGGGRPVALGDLQVADRNFERPRCPRAGMCGSLHGLDDWSFEVTFTADLADARGDIFDDCKKVITPAVVDHHSALGNFSAAKLASIVSSLHDFLRCRKVASHFSGRRLGSYTVGNQEDFTRVVLHRANGVNRTRVCEAQY
jgi:hypothetical protein